MNFAIKKKTDQLYNKIELERLFYAIKCKEEKSELSIEDKPDILIWLKTFALRDPQDFSGGNLMHKQHQALKSLKRNQEIIIQRPDKGAGVMVINENTYNSKSGTLVFDQEKFSLTDGKETETIKSKNNKVIEKYKSLDPTSYKTLKRVGEFSSSHLYGLPKIHRSETYPPLRHIISMLITISHEVPQHLNGLIQPYLNTKYVVRSSEQFLVASLIACCP